MSMSKEIEERLARLVAVADIPREILDKTHASVILALENAIAERDRARAQIDALHLVSGTVDIEIMGDVQ